MVAEPSHRDDMKICVRRHPSDHATAVYRFSDVGGLHWDSTSGGVGRRTSHSALFGYVMCDGSIEGAVSHTCRHGPPPHRIKVCIPKVCNKEDWKSILAKAPPQTGSIQEMIKQSGRDRVALMAEATAGWADAMRKKQQEDLLRSVFDKAQFKAIDKWIAKQNDPAIDRPEAIRRLVELGLEAHAPERKVVERLRERVAGAAELAAKAVDSLTVGAADADKKASRKRRLTKAKGK
jgi:hypothetical protein